MAIDLINSAEGGTNGTAVQTTGANTGGASGDQFTSAAVPSGSVVRFSSAAAFRGALGYEITQVASNFAALVWAPSGQAAAPAAARVMFKRPSAAPTAIEPVLALRGSGLACDLCVATDNRLVVRSASGATLWTSTSAIPADWVELDLRAIRGTGTTDGTIGAAYWLPGATSPTETYLETNRNAGTTDIGTVRIGRGSTNAATYGPAMFDELAFSTGRTSFIGPPVGAPPVVAVVTAGGVLVAATNLLGGAGSTGSALTYSITQTSGPAVAALQVSNGNWFISPHASATLVYAITVTQADGQNAEYDLTVPPVSSSSAGGPRIRRRRMQGGVLG